MRTAVWEADAGCDDVRSRPVEQRQYTGTAGRVGNS